ncbi:hypothetical protein BLNAU_10569 [Blattamonas nauphoetae]|uniref:Uncharacterized protein n=1 Tax=Blattamonas nauphoetae TaxID=2049346 RepID=A0ABQ9XSS0_9EUKA|nr:hypothetical protein BLNAU_10569 [Blattamonas nauphoetae]
MKQFRFHDVAARRAQAIAEEEEESIVPPPSTPKSQQSRMLFALSTPTRQTPQRVKTEDKVEKMLRNQMSGAVNPGEITYSIEESTTMSEENPTFLIIEQKGCSSITFVCALSKIES